eukprot:SAG31_NODE_1522_length_8012_cov_6.903336_5_plen_162_part_00
MSSFRAEQAQEEERVVLAATVEGLSVELEKSIIEQEELKLKCERVELQLRQEREGSSEAAAALDSLRDEHKDAVKTLTAQIAQLRDQLVSVAVPALTDELLEANVEVATANVLQQEASGQVNEEVDKHPSNDDVEEDIDLDLDLDVPPPPPPLLAESKDGA